MREQDEAGRSGKLELPLWAKPTGDAQVCTQLQIYRVAKTWPPHGLGSSDAWGDDPEMFTGEY